MAAACAFCVFRLYPTPSDFNSTNFLQKPPLDPNTQTAGQKHRCNNSLQHKLAAKLYFESSSAKKGKKKEKKNQQIMHCTTHSDHIWENCDVILPRTQTWAPDDCDQSARYIVSFVNEERRGCSTLLPPKMMRVMRRNFLGMKKSSPSDLKMTKRAGLSGELFFSSRNRTPKFDFSEFVCSLPDMSTPLAADASLLVRYINLAVCPTDTFIRHHARAGSQFANALISHNGFMWLVSRQLANLLG